MVGTKGLAVPQYEIVVKFTSLIMVGIRMSELVIWGFDVAIGDLKTKTTENEITFFSCVCNNEDLL
jgi:hypothetical protein